MQCFVRLLPHKPIAHNATLYSTEQYQSLDSNSTQTETNPVIDVSKGKRKSYLRTNKMGYKVC